MILQWRRGRNVQGKWLSEKEMAEDILRGSVRFRASDEILVIADTPSFVKHDNVVGLLPRLKHHVWDRP